MERKRIRQRVPKAIFELSDSFNMCPVAIWTHENEIEIYFMENDPSDITRQNFQNLSQSFADH